MSSETSSAPLRTPIENVRIDGPRPRPDADRLETGRIDLDDHQPAGRVAGGSEIARLRELEIDEIEGAKQIAQGDQEKDQDALDMRLHPVHRVIDRLASALDDSRATLRGPRRPWLLVSHPSELAAKYIMLGIKVAGGWLARPAGAGPVSSVVCSSC